MFNFGYSCLLPTGVNSRISIVIFVIIDLNIIASHFIVASHEVNPWSYFLSFTIPNQTKIQVGYHQKQKHSARMNNFEDLLLCHF